jgi:hypothetical protein
VDDLYGELYQRCIDLEQRLSALDLAAQRRTDRAVRALEEELREERAISSRLAAQVRRLLDQGAVEETG